MSPSDTPSLEPITPAAPPVRMSVWKLSLHDYCDALSGLVICFAAVFSPWAFGTTDSWAIWTMNILGLALGALLFIKLAVRFSTRFQFPRWDEFERNEDGSLKGVRFRQMRLALVISSALVVLYCWVSAWNSGATVDMGTFTLAERPYISWLPHSFDAPSSWEAFWRYFALTLSFWALQDWLMGKSSRDLRISHRGIPGEDRHGRSDQLPQRVIWLLWVLTINGALLGLEGIIQRTTGTNSLLFMKIPPEQVQVEGQFGPYAYRANACQYFNLIWPLALGLWWVLRRNRRESASRLKTLVRPVPLIAAGIMALCPLIATSRLGALTAALSIVASAVVIWTGTRANDRKLRMGIVGVVMTIFALGFLLGWNRLDGRLAGWSIESSFDVRNTMYDLADKMATDNPVWGTGPGTFANLYFLYRKDPNEDWFAQLHNDWLETQITFGWVGCSLIALSLIILFARWFASGNIGGGRRLPILLWIAVAGCFFEGRWDYPFQVYSVIFAFMIACCVLFLLCRHRYR